MARSVSNSYQFELFLLFAVDNLNTYMHVYMYIYSLRQPTHVPCVAVDTTSAASYDLSGLTKNNENWEIQYACT